MNCKLRRLDLLRNGHLSDCELHVCYLDKVSKNCCRRQFRLHQKMLVSASEVFERLMHEPQFENDKRIIYEEDASPDAYEVLLVYIYTYEVCSVTLDMCSDLLYLATKYKMHDLIDCYIKRLASQDWPMEVVLQIFHLANEHNSAEIMNMVESKILPVAKQVLNDNSFLMLNLQELKALMILLKSKKIIPDEDLLAALKKYQINNNISYNNMQLFQQFIEVAQLFGNVLFEPNGTLVTKPIMDKKSTRQNN